MTHALTRSPHPQLTSSSSASSLSSFSVPAVMPLSSSSSAVSVVPLKAPQPPLFLDASHFTSLMKEHQSNIAQQQRSISLQSSSSSSSLQQQQQQPAMPLRPLPHPPPSASSSPGSSPSAAELTSASPSATSLTLSSSLPLSWSSQRGGDSFTGSFPPSMFSSLSMQRGGPGAAGQQLFAASPSPPPAAAAAAAQQLQALASSSAAASSSSASSGQPPSEHVAGSELSYTPLSSPSPFYPASPPGSLQSFSSLYPQPPSPALPSVSPFPVHSAYFPTDSMGMAYAAQSQQAYMQMVKGLVNAQSGSVMALDSATAAAGGKRKAEAQQYLAGSAATAAAAAAVAAAAAAAAAGAGPTGGRHSACAVCHSAKTSCNGQRPCDRCIRLDRQSLCVDRPRKQPTRSDKKKDSNVSSKKLKLEQAADEQQPDDQKPAKQTSRDKKVKEEDDKGGGGSSSGSSGKEMNGAAAAPVKVEATSASVGSLPASSAPSSTLSPAGDLQRLLSNHSTSSSSSSSAASTPSSPASAAQPAHDDNTIDVSTASAASSLPAERRLSSTYLRMHQLHHTRTAIADAIKQGLATPAQVHFLLSYLGAVLHPDDFMQLLRPSQSSSSAPAAAAAAAAAMPGELVSASGVYVPRYVFNFACSPLEPIPDCSVLGMDFATLQIMRADSAALAAMNWEQGEASTAPEAATAPAGGADDTQTAAGAAAADAKADSAAEGDRASEEASTGGAAAADSESNGKNHQPAAHPVSFASSTSAFSAFSPTSSSASPVRGQARSASPSAPSSPASSSSPSSGSSASSSSASSSCASSPSGPCEIFLIVRVNREFERLFGFSQASMRDLFRSEGGKVLYTLLTPQSMGVLSRWLTEALTGGRSEMKAIVTIVNKWRGRTDCLLNTRWTLDGSGMFRQVTYCFAPLPEKGKS